MIPGWGRSLEKELATHSGILAWKNPMDRGAWQVTDHGLQRVGHDLLTKETTATVQHRELYSILCNNPDRKESEKKIYVYV